MSTVLEPAEQAESREDLLTVEKLLKEERGIASYWWTVLNEMRFQKQLPEWVLKIQSDVGSHASMDSLMEIQDRADMAIGSLRNEYTYEVWDEKRNVLADGFRSLPQADEAANELRKQYPTAGVARVRCDRFDYVTVSLREQSMETSFIKGTAKLILQACEGHTDARTSLECIVRAATAITERANAELKRLGA